MTSPVVEVDPHQKGWVWRSAELVLVPFFAIWNRYRSRGAEHLPEKGALLLINHQSFVDPLYAAAAVRDRPVSYLARHNLFSVPVIGWILRRTFVIPIQRDKAGTESIRRAIERLQQGYLVGIFPEGTRSSGGEVRPIKPGLLSIIRRVDIPILPVGIAGADRVLPRGALWMRPANIRVVIGDPLEPELVAKLSQPGQEQEFLELVRQRIQQCVHEAERL